MLSKSQDNWRNICTVAALLLGFSSSWHLWSSHLSISNTWASLRKELACLTGCWLWITFIILCLISSSVRHCPLFWQILCHSVMAAMGRKRFNALMSNFIICGTHSFLRSISWLHASLSMKLYKADDDRVGNEASKSEQDWKDKFGGGSSCLAPPLACT